MKVAILGANGTIGRYLVEQLKTKHSVTAVTRQTLELTNTGAVLEFFVNNHFDVVINAAINSDSQMTPFDQTVVRENLAMFSNLYAARGCFGRLINFGSGAEFDRSQHVFNAREEDLFLSLPADHYGMSKNFCSRIAFDTDNFYTLRLFGVFHPSEPAKRLLPRILSKTPTVVEDKYFDYIFLEDVLPVVEYYIEQTPKFKDINLVYPEKTLLSYFIRRFCEINSIDDSLIEISARPGLNYTGSSTRIQELNLPMIGIEQGFKKY